MTISIDIATEDSHDYVITRENARTGAEYNVWVRVDSYDPGERGTRWDPGYGPEVEAEAWGTLGQEIELTQDEETELIIWCQECRDGYWGP